MATAYSSRESRAVLLNSISDGHRLSPSFVIDRYLELYVTDPGVFVKNSNRSGGKTQGLPREFAQVRYGAYYFE